MIWSIFDGSDSDPDDLSDDETEYVYNPGGSNDTGDDGSLVCDASYSHDSEDDEDTDD
jgi:hypothetical protein